MKMNAKKIVILISSLALACVLTCLCLIFLTNKVIKEVPTTLEVQKIDDDFVLITEYSNEYLYNFKLEQKIDGKFVVLDVVKSKTNCLNLSEQHLDFALGNEFRFSSGFATENGSGDGKFCTPISWTPTKSLQEVEIQSFDVDFQTETISWGQVDDADFYALDFINQDGRFWTFTTYTNSFSWSDEKHEMKAGEFSVFVTAKSENANILPSKAVRGCEGLEIALQNEILDFSLGEESLMLRCSQKVKILQVDIEGVSFQIELDLPVEDGNDFIYDVSQHLSFFKNIDFSYSDAQLKTLTNGLVLESELFNVQ